MAKISDNIQWSVYILRCGDGSYYTGVTKSVKRRVEEHENGKGAKYLRGRGPLEVVFQKIVESYGSALKKEKKIKKLSRINKIKLISDSSLFDLL